VSAGAQLECSSLGEAFCWPSRDYVSLEIKVTAVGHSRWTRQATRKPWRDEYTWTASLTKTGISHLLLSCVFITREPP
jgi:hypothetical protein